MQSDVTARARTGEALFGAIAFAVLCIAVLTITPRSAEPDDGAYRASIVAIADGHLLSLSLAQALSLSSELDDNPAAPPNQWVQLPDGRYLSEKDPGYPFLAAPFAWLGVIRWAPLFYGAVSCFALFVGARRWLGTFGGAAAVALYCSSGAAMAFAWRDYMPTFTDASLVAAGSGALLWTLLATEASARLRTLAGLAGFLALELATFARYTNIVILGCAVVTVMIVWRTGNLQMPGRSLLWWLASVIVFGAGVAVFDDVVYGGPLRTGYAPGEVTFSGSAVGTNMRLMPSHLLQAMPMMLLALAALGWIIARGIGLRHIAGPAGTELRRDLWVGVALASSWVAIWALYSTYTWTTDPTNAGIADVRFYVPAIGAISLLGAWLIIRVAAGHRWRSCAAMIVVAAMFGLGVWSFHAMYAAYGVPLT